MAQTLKKSLNFLELKFEDFWITSLVHAKYQVKIILGRKIYIYEPIHFFWGYFYNFWYAKDDKITISGDVSEQGNMQKAVSKGWYKESISSDLK